MLRTHSLPGKDVWGIKQQHDSQGALWNSIWQDRGDLSIATCFYHRFQLRGLTLQQLCRLWPFPMLSPSAWKILILHFLLKYSYLQCCANLCCTAKWLSCAHIRSDQSLSRVRLFTTPWIAARQASLSITNSWSSLRLTSIEPVMPSSHLILCRPLLLLPPIPPSIRIFSNGSTLRVRWPKYWSFSFSISPSKGHPGLISFRMDWLDLLAVQGTLKSLLQHHSSKASILRPSAFFTVQLSHPYSIITHIYVV